MNDKCERGSLWFLRCVHMPTTELDLIVKQLRFRGAVHYEPRGGVCAGQWFDDLPEFFFFQCDGLWPVESLSIFPASLDCETAR